ncbi:MAG: redoxin family protein, partial [Desulfuromonadales bacterium]|nr:redoxin family protein [Desulfuromonadales bacterium]
IILLKLATTWCPTCKQQVEEIADIGSFLQERDVALLEVFFQDTEAMLQDHQKATNYPMSHHVLQGDNKVAKAYNLYVIPRLLVIDRDFKVRRDGSLISAYDLKRLVGELATP